MRSLRACARHSLSGRFTATIGPPRFTPWLYRQKRCVHLDPILLPPAIFTGLLGALWLWKCTMMVIFQNKIIYMPGMPPNARRETLADYAPQCWGVRWREERIRSMDGTDLAMAVSHVSPLGGNNVEKRATEGGGQEAGAHVYVLYFQGNASSIPPRLPDLSCVLHAVAKSKDSRLASVQFTMICLSYRGYWTSRGRASERGIKLDAEAALQWISDSHTETHACRGPIPEPIVVLWGQSIGSGVASNLAASSSRLLKIDAMLLETPFLSIRDMLVTLYPQKWLPYRYLWPFLRNHLNSWENLGTIAELSRTTGTTPPEILILEAGRDELVPAQHGEKLLQRCRDVGLSARKETVPRAYHNESMIRAEGRRISAEFILGQARRHVDP